MTWLARIIALALLVVLVDAVVAALTRTNDALISAAIAAVLGVLAIALFWPRPWLAATCTFLVLAATCALAGVRSGDGGPALTGLGSADVAAAVVTACMVVAAVAVFRAFRSSLVRGVSVALAAYAIVCTAATLGHGGLAAAFATAPLAWARGTYVGAEALLPAGSLVAVGLALDAMRRRRGGSAATAFLLALALAAGAHVGAVAAGAAGLPTIVAFEGRELNSQSAELLGPDRSVPFVPSTSGAVAPEVVAAAAIAGRTPEQALHFVASLADDLYPGALAGAVGALRSSSGNSIDKALLLRDLLRAGSPDLAVTFARCALSPEAADALVGHVRSAPVPHAKMVLQQANGFVQTARDPGTRATLQRWSSAWTTLLAQTYDESAKLSTALRNAGVALPATEPAALRLRSLATPHVWIRAQVNGNWTDLDPTIERPAAGKTRCAAESATPALPDDLFDVLDTRVVVENVQNGVPQRTIAFHRTMRTADIADRDVSFMFAEPVGAEGLLPPPRAEQAGVASFTPFLLVGDEHLVGTAITLPLPTNRTTGKSAIEATLGAVEQLAPTSPTPSAQPNALPVVSGCWLELSVDSPAGRTPVQTAIFDRVGFAERAAHTAFPALSAEPPVATYRAMQTVWNVAVAAGAAVSATGPVADSGVGDDASKLSRGLARAHGTYYALRRALFDDARKADVGLAAAFPGISLLGLRDRGLFMDVSSDGALPVIGDDTRPVWSVASVLAERALVNASTLFAPNDTRGIDGNDALTELDRASASGLPPVALRPTDRTPPDSLALPAEARARISAHLTRGASVLAFADDGGHTSPYTYWVLDSSSGTLRDEDASGRHSEPGEEVTVDEEVTVKNFSTFRRLSCKVAPVLRLAWFALHVLHGPSIGGLAGLAAANKRAADEAVDQAQAGLNKPNCAGP